MNHVFIPNYPPPPLLLQIANNLNTPSPSVIPQINLNLYKERLNNYLEHRKSHSIENISSKNSQNTLKLSEISHEMSQCVQLIESLNGNIEALSQDAPEMNETQWNDHISKLNFKLGDLSSICSKYNDNYVRSQVKSLIDKRLKKRNRIKKRKIETKILKRYVTIKRAEKHQQIDKWMEKNAEEILKNRQQIETKQCAEQMFMDVKNRQNEANKYIQLMDSLKEFHRIRNRDKYIGSGQNDVEFNQEIDDMKQMWMDFAKTYKIEEKRLRKFINCTDNWEEWQNILFGETTKYDQIFELHKKNDVLSDLIEIRRLWDQFIVTDDNPFGTSIPFGWVIPNSNPSDLWKKYLKNQDNL